MEGNIVNDWRLRYKPDVRKMVLDKIVEKVKKLFPKHNVNKIEEIAVKLEENIYAIATDKDDYLHKLSQKLYMTEKRTRDVPDPSAATQVMNQARSLPTSLPYSQTPTSQQWLPQGRKDILPLQKQQQQPESTNSMSQNQQLRDMRSRYMQQLPQPSSLSSIQQSIHQPSSSGQENSQYLPRPQFPAQRICPSHHQQQQQNHQTLPKSIEELGKSQQIIYKPRHPDSQKQPQDRTLEQHFDDTQRLQAEGSLRQTQNITHHQNQQKQRISLAYPSTTTSQDSTGKTVNVSGLDWQEETYHKIKSLTDKHKPNLSTMFQRVGEKLREIDSLRQQRLQDKATDALRGVYSTLEKVISFLNVDRSIISELHRDNFCMYEEQILTLTKKIRQKPVQQQQELIPPPQIHQVSLQSQTHLENDQMKSRLMQSNQNGVAKSEPHLLQTSSRASQENVLLKNPQVLHSDISPVRSIMFQEKQAHNRKMQQPILHRNQQQQKATSHQTNEINNVKRKQGINTKAGLLPTPKVPPAKIQQHSSLVPGELEKWISGESTWEDPPELIKERPIDRLIKAIQSSSQNSLQEAAREMNSLISKADRIAGSFHSNGGSKAGLAEDLSAPTKLRLCIRDSMRLGETNPSKRMRRSIEIKSEACNNANANLEILQPGFAILQEIKDINGRFVETMVNLCDEDVASGTIVTCCYVPVALCATFKALYKSGQLSQIQPLRILVPTDYPLSSPIVLENTTCDASIHKYEDLSARTRSRFDLHMRGLSEPISLKVMAQTWNDCARATLAQYAERWRHFQLQVR